MTAALEPVDVVISGGGSDGAAQQGALEVVRKRFKIVRIGGASAGSINAAGTAAGIENMAALWSHFLSRGDLEDWHLPGILKPLGILRSKPRYGMMAGQKIYQALREELGTARMCDLEMPTRIVVGNLWKRKIQVVDSQLGLIELLPDGKVKVVERAARYALQADVVRCSCAVPVLMDAWSLWPGSPLLFTDGGAGANAPAGLWDDSPERRTVVIRFREDEVERPIVNLPGFLSALFDLRQDAANTTFPSIKKQTTTILIPSSGNSMDFSLDKAEVERRRLVGVQAAKSALGMV